MSNVGDVFRIKMFTSNNTGEFLNVFHYKQTIGSNIANAPDRLEDSFYSVVWGALRPVINVAVRLRTIEIENLNNPVEYLEEIYPDTVGNRGLENSPEGPPDFVTWAFYCRRTALGFKSARKSFSGLGDGQYAGNSPTAAALNLLNQLASSLSADLGVSDTPGEGIVSPFVKRAADTVPPFDGYFAKNWQFRHVGTQNTRKPY